MIRQYFAQVTGVSKGIASNEVKNPVTTGIVATVAVIVLIVIVYNLSGKKQ